MVKYQGHWDENDERTKDGLMNPKWNHILDEEGNSIVIIDGYYIHEKYSDISSPDEKFKLIHRKQTQLGIFVQDAINEKIKRDKLKL